MELPATPALPATKDEEEEYYLPLPELVRLYLVAGYLWSRAQTRNDHTKMTVYEDVMRILWSVKMAVDVAPALEKLKQGYERTHARIYERYRGRMEAMIWQDREDHGGLVSAIADPDEWFSL